jgi:hypothetical protein
VLCPPELSHPGDVGITSLALSKKKGGFTGKFPGYPCRIVSFALPAAIYTAGLTDDGTN